MQLALQRYDVNEIRRLRHLAAAMRRGSSLVVYGAALLALLAGGSVVATWMLSGHSPRTVPASILGAAMGLVLAGLALALVGASRGTVRWLTRLSQVLGAVVALIGAAACSTHLLDGGVAIDDLLPDHVRANSWALSLPSAIGLAGAGLALLLTPVQRSRKVVVAVAAAVALLGLVSVLRWSATGPVEDPPAARMSLYVALSLVLLGAGVVVAAYRLSNAGRLYRLFIDTVQLKLVTSFVGAVLALVTIAGLAYSAAVQRSLAAQQLNRFHEAREQLADMHADLADAVVTQRTYLLTAPPTSPAPSLLSIGEFEKRGASLRESMRGFSESEQALLAVIQADATDLLTALGEGVRLYQQQGADAARAFVLSGHGTRALSNLRASLAQMDLQEREQVARYEQVLLENRDRAVWGAVLALLISASLLAWGLPSIRTEMDRRAATERAQRRISAGAVAAHRFLESVVQNIPHLIFIKEAQELRFVLLNRAAEETLGFNQAEMIGKNDYDFFPPEQADFFNARDREVLQRGDILDIPEEQIQSATLGPRLLHTRKIPLRDEAGRPTHMLGISEDVTVAREQERRIHLLNQQLATRAAEVERMNKAKSEFLATMSHEIRTPMNGMLGMLELLSLRDLDDTSRDTLNVVRQSGLSLLRIIDDVLDFSKIEAGKLELRPEVASVEAIVRDIRHVHTAAASRKGLVITATIDPALSPASLVDPVRLRQVLNNFVSNAVKFTPEGEVRLQVEVVSQKEDAQSLRFTVADTGVGISPEEQERLFSPFVQVGAARAGASGGTGLGLVISRQLIELMGGTTELRSAPGKGTSVSFLVELPTASPDLLPEGLAHQSTQMREALARTRSAPDVQAAQQEGTLVLVVDDHPTNRALLAQQLHVLGYACELAENGLEALQAWRSGRFALVLTDCHMPGMDGYQLARHIRSEEATGGAPQPVPIVACTAMALPKEVRKCLDAGMNDCVIKPVSLAAMRDKLAKWLPLATAEGLAQPQRQDAAAGPSGLAIDRSFIAETWGCGPARVEAILEGYARSAAEDHRALHDAAARGDLQEVANVAHRMVGASKMVGASALAEACARVNTVSREGRRDGLAGSMEALDTEYQRMRAELDAHSAA
jgi:PAS domain S-box-containing protein